MGTKINTTLFQGALILTLASLLSKLLSAVYRVPFQNMVGDEGFYIFQQAYPFYGISMTLSLTAAPLFISKVVAEYNGDYNAQRWFLERSKRYLGVLGFVLFIALFIAAPWLANTMGDPSLTGIIRVTSVTYLLLPYLGSYRGFYQGDNDMTPTAVSQAVEQVVRVAIIIVGAYIGVYVLDVSLYHVGELAMSGAIIGGAAGAIILAVFDKKRRGLQQIPTMRPENLQLPRGIWRDMFAVIITSALLIWFQMADAFQIFRLLVASGIETDQAKILKGVYDRGQPLIQLGVVVVTSFSLSIIPMISKARIQRERVKLQRLVSFFMRTGIALGLAITVALVVMMPTLNYALFADYEGVDVLQVFVAGLFLLTLLVIITSVLQGFNSMKAPAIAAVCGIIIKVMLNGVWLPEHGIIGSAWATNSALLASVLISVVILKQSINFEWPSWQFLIKLSFSVALMAAPLIIINYLPFVTNHRIVGLVVLIIASLIGALLFLFSASYLRVITRQDIVMLPMGRSVIKLIKKMKR